MNCIDDALAKLGANIVKYDYSTIKKYDKVSYNFIILTYIAV